MLTIFMLGTLFSLLMLWILAIGTVSDDSRSSLFNNFGKGGTTVVQPAPQPAVQDTMGQYVQSLPALYEAQMQYSPLLAQQEVDLMTQYGSQYGQAVKSAQEAMYPETSALQEDLASQATAGMSQGLSDAEREMYRDVYAANLGTNAGSGIGADYMSTGMLQAQQGRQDYYRNLGLSLAGRQQLSSPAVAGQTSWMQGYQPGQALGYAANTYGSYQGGLNAMNSANASLQSSQNQMFGQMAGGALGGLGMFMASDSCLKEDIKTIDEALEIINQIDAVKYKWKESQQIDGGVVAQQLEEVMPDAVIEIDGIKHVKPMLIIGYLIKAVQELSKKLEDKDG